LIAAAWSSADDWRAAMDGGVPCGCDLARRAARRDPNDPQRAPDEDAGREAQARWGCPAAGHAPRAQDDDDCRETLAALARVTGRPSLTACAGCPQEPTDRPWVRTVLAAHSWLEKGQLELRVGPHPEGALVACLDALDVALAARAAHEIDAQRERAKAAERERAQAAVPAPKPLY